MKAVWVYLTIHDASEESPDEPRDAWQGVYDGLTDEEMAQIEALAIDRSHVMRQES